MTPRPDDPVPKPAAPPPAPIVLPRPNHGPLPWENPSGSPWPLGAAVLGLGLVAAIVARRRRLRRRSEPAAAVEAGPVGESAPGESTNEAEGTPDRVREALVRAFGAGWRARTTEEIAASGEVAGRFGAEVAGRIVAYLGAVDRSKFSGDPAPPPDDLGWWAERFAEEVGPPSPPGSAGPTSISTGR